MRHWILFAAVVLLSVLARGQERTASVLLTDGQRFSGRVVAMDLAQVQLAIDGKIYTFASENISRCEITPVQEQKSATEAEEAEGGEEAASTPPADEPAPAASPVRGVPSGQADPPPAVGEVIAPAVDVAGGGLFRARVSAFSSTYPWLFPEGPAQWLSVALLLFAVLTLVIHSSARIVGVEAVQFVRSMGLALGYLVVASAQIWLLPSNDLTIFSALIGNSAIVLFAVRKTFDLPRMSTFVAVAVQVGFLMLALSVLQLVDSLLGSVAT
jgi:hypothetical protein